MNQEQFKRLLSEPEGEHLEFKSGRSTFSTEKILEYAVALANEGGGKLVLGVADTKPRTIVGTSAYGEGFAKIKEQLYSQLRLRIDIDEVLCHEGRVIVFYIPSRPTGMPLHLNGRYLMRAGESLTGMSPDTIKRILEESNPDYSAEVLPRAQASDLDPDSIEEFKRRWIEKSRNASIGGMPQEQLLRDAELTVDGGITIAALVLFGKRESLGRLLSNAEVIFEYRANDAPGPAQQREEFRQGFFSFYDRLWQLIDLRNTKQHFQDGFFMWDIKTFNEGAIREAILNAVSHRDYRSGMSVFVRQYPDRIEITNPGGPPPGVTLVNILNEQSPRNRRIADSLARAGLVERAGQGMNRIFSSCIRETKPEPDFRNTDADHFWITLHGRIQHPEFLRALEKIGQDRLISFGVDDFIVLQKVFRNEPVPDRLERIIDQFIEEGIVEKIPKGSSGHKLILSRKLYSAIGKKGVYTRKKGLDRSTHKELLLKHIGDCGDEGARMEEFRQILPFLDRGNIQVLLREMREEALIHHHGNTRAGRWYKGPLNQDCNHLSENDDGGKAK